ncbi:hypothetical protein C8034_v011260 [Colletotrichum sidae]|uniref:Secreted protein n=1 Tax=Colletotrichum sidae TaxID=1347389 RepID=A0A4R8TCG7_9PEZI|nr:hypothetical protein C8034_v011260 [Colletotrichum sidae]
MGPRVLALVLLALCRGSLAYIGPGCTQTHCQVSVCAADADAAYDEASLGLNGIMGPDCASWQPGFPTDGGRGPCAAGLRVYSGNFDIWRAWTTSGDDYSATFAQWGNFLGATCTGGKIVTCEPKSGRFPNSSTGKCQVDACVTDGSCVKGS